ncbi:pyridoxal-phosphate dependent enzyme [Embleya hyalina]|uniref:2,3-diaminopropionate biosynthesis protein SbnA n=1 Tax=Embleya hyalina TaxID=516124 RepID=A0A401Z0F7_9ACTN|nr:pyridoxal-phosphate dependent enzyme [Embleya hyalina]GCE00312.1 2,3-diaminopropionate biosynthesis protein SbnA [Embleya hyalina]
MNRGSTGPPGLDAEFTLPRAGAGEPGIGGTPLVPLILPVCGVDRRLWLKLEGANAYGSIKARTAHALIEHLERDGGLVPGGSIVESTSGNLGVALAGICRARGYRCTLVVDRDTPRRSITLMADAGADVVLVEPTADGNPVAERLRMVRRILAADRRMRWTDQYGSPANPSVHERWTGPELARGVGAVGPDAVVAAISTGGTLAGLSAYFRRAHPNTTIVGVDAVGSAATGGERGARPAKIPGFGSGRRSSFLRPGDWDMCVRVHDEYAAPACRVVRAATGLTLGGSSGAALLGAVVAARGDPELREIGVICPDLGAAYLNTVYASRRPPPPGSEPALREGLADLAAARRRG